MFVGTTNSLDFEVVCLAVATEGSSGGQERNIERTAISVCFETVGLSEGGEDLTRAERSRRLENPVWSEYLLKCAEASALLSDGRIAVSGPYGLVHMETKGILAEIDAEVLKPIRRHQGGRKLPCAWAWIWRESRCHFWSPSVR